jgi:hypothetical protein
VYETFNARVSLSNTLAIKDIRQGHNHCSKLKLPREKDSSPTHHANHTYGGADIESALYRIFLSLNLEKEILLTFITRIFLIIFRNK